MAGDQELVARDFFGLGLMEPTANKENPRVAPVGWSKYGGKCQAPLTHVNHDTAVLKQVPWATGFAMPHIQPSISLQEGKPDDLMLRPANGSQMQDILNGNQREALSNQARWYRTQLIDNVTHPKEEWCSGGFGGLEKPVVSLGMLGQNEQASPPVLRGHIPMTFTNSDRQLPWPMLGGFQTGTQTRMPYDALEKHSSAQLTIFYRGNVNVYDDIPVEKAQAIMSYAGSGGAFLGGSLHENAQAQVKLQPNAQSLQIASSCQPVADQNNASLPANRQADYLQPAVPRALPLARKASLARFLEKRRERVHMKSPYMMTKPEQPGERFSSSNYASTPCDESVNMMLPLPCGVEGMAEHSPGCEMVIKEEASVSNTGS